MPSSKGEPIPKLVHRLQGVISMAQGDLKSVLLHRDRSIGGQIEREWSKYPEIN